MISMPGTTPATTPPIHDVRYRHISPDDWRRLQAFHRRLSATTVELRFHGAKRELSTPLAHTFTAMDGHDNVAIVATTGTRGRIVGVARYSRIENGTAEVAVVVEDAYQHHRIGSHLMCRLRDYAVAHNVSEFVAEVLPGNSPMVHLLRDTGPTECRLNRGVLQTRTRLTK